MKKVFTVLIALLFLGMISGCAKNNDSAKQNETLSQIENYQSNVVTEPTATVENVTTVGTQAAETTENTENSVGTEIIEDTKMSSERETVGTVQPTSHPYIAPTEAPPTSDDDNWNSGEQTSGSEDWSGGEQSSGDDDLDSGEDWSGGEVEIEF